MSMLVLSFVCLVASTVAMEVGENYAIKPADQDWLTSLFYIPATPRVRKEYRMLTDEERDRFHGAIIKMKKDRTVEPNKYELLTSLHARRPSRNSAHRGTGFLAWHRVYLLLVENALREQDPDVTVPYWDCTLDAVLAVPRDSSLFSEDFMGNGDGQVITGPFKDWSVQTGTLYRTVGIMHAPLSDKNITHMLQQHLIRNISYPLYGKDEENVFELIHNRVHHWIGGEMKAIETAADDPIFHPYHSFVSLVWEEFRTLQRQRGIDPELDWDEFYGQGRHHKYSPMGLGNLMASDGANDLFAENIVFDKRPSCSKDSVECGSPYLYCNVTMEKCSPWTLEEYSLIKIRAKDKNATVKDVIEPYIRSKLKRGFSELSDKGFELTKAAATYMGSGIVDMFEVLEKRNQMPEPATKEGMDWNEVFSGNDGHAHEHEAYNPDLETGDGITEHSHGDHEHSHNYSIIGGKGKHSGGKTAFQLFLEEYCLVVLGGLIIFRIVFAVLVKCKSDPVFPLLCGSRKQKYHMDGIVNVNFREEDVKESNGDLQSHRLDNLYTVTVTANCLDSGVNATFVRFAKYNHDEINPITDKTDEKQQREIIENQGDYMDMTAARRCLEQNATDVSSDLFEHEPNEQGEKDELLDELEPKYNSIENENFDFIRAAIRDAGEDADDDSVDDVDDLFNTYDNFIFKRENGDVGKEIPTTKDVENTVEAVVQKHADNYYPHYLPGTYM